MKPFTLLGAALLAFGLQTISIAQTDLAAGLVAYYPFNGNARDESAGNPVIHDGATIGPILAVDRFNRAGACYEFNGTTDYIKTTAFSTGLPSSNRTISVWFKPNNLVRTVDFEGLIGYGGNGCATAFYLAVNRNRVVVHSHCTGTSADVDADVTSDRWHHLAVAISDDLVTFYFDGASIGSTKVKFDTTYVVNRSIYIGASVDGFGSGPFSNVDLKLFRGRIDDVRVYNRALSKTEVRDLYRSEQLDGQTAMAIDVKTVRVTMYVKPNRKYQLQASLDLKTWTNVGAAFLTVNTIVMRDVETLDIGQYFRLYEVQ